MLLPSTMAMKLASSPCEETLDDHAVARVTKFIAGEHVVYRRFGFSFAHGDHYAFARSEAVGLDNDGCAFGADIVFGRGDVGEGLVARRGDLMTLEEVFSERLRAFELRCRLTWPKAGLGRARGRNRPRRQLKAPRGRRW
jgi:hypothetical protein